MESLVGVYSALSCRDKSELSINLTCKKKQQMTFLQLINN